MRPQQKRNFISYYIEIKLKENNPNFSLSEIIQNIAQYRYSEKGHNFEQYESEIIKYYKNLGDNDPGNTYKLTLKEKRII